MNLFEEATFAVAHYTVIIFRYDAQQNVYAVTKACSEVLYALVCKLQHGIEPLYMLMKVIHQEA